MNDESLNIADVKKHFSEIVGQVAYGGKRILITKRGKPMARLIPVDEDRDRHIGYAKGWLDGNDSFFNTIDCIIDERSDHIPRIMNQELL